MAKGIIKMEKVSLPYLRTKKWGWIFGFCLGCAGWVYWLLLGLLLSYLHARLSLCSCKSGGFRSRCDYSIVRLFNCATEECFSGDDRSIKEYHLLAVDCCCRACNLPLQLVCGNACSQNPKHLIDFINVLVKTYLIIYLFCEVCRPNGWFCR